MSYNPQQLVEYYMSTIRYFCNPTEPFFRANIRYSTRRGYYGLRDSAWAYKSPLELHVPLISFMTALVSNDYGLIQRLNDVAKSTLYMHRERVMRYEEAGRKWPPVLEPVFASLKNSGFEETHGFMLCLYWDALLSDLWNYAYKLELANGYIMPASEFFNVDGIMVYDQARIDLFEQAELQKLLRQREAAALEALAAQGFTPAQILAISQVATATDPATLNVLQNMVYNMMKGMSTPTAAQVVQQVTHPTQPAVTTNQQFQAEAALQVTISPGNMPSGLSVPTDTVTQAHHVVQTVTTYQSADFARAMSIYEAGIDWNGLVFNRLFGQSAAQAQRAIWQAKAPQVQLRPEDNQHLRADVLNLVWNKPGERPPLVLLRVTPRQKPLPQVKRSLFTRIWGVVAPVVAAIPGVGPALSIAGSIVNAQITASNINQQLQTFMQNRIPADAFEPQYYPQTFKVMLPLDMAQAAVREPWSVKILYDYFIDRQAQEYMRLVQSALPSGGQTATASRPVTVRPGSAPRSTVNLNPFGLRR